MIFIPRPNPCNILMVMSIARYGDPAVKLALPINEKQSKMGGKSFLRSHPVCEPGLFYGA